MNDEHLRLLALECAVIVHKGTGVDWVKAIQDAEKFAEWVQTGNRPLMSITEVVRAARSARRSPSKKKAAKKKAPKRGTTRG